MTRKLPLFVAVAVVMIGFSPTSHAAGPFAKLRGNACCDAGCDAGACETDCCDAAPCGEPACEAAKCDAAPCDSVCDAAGGCDSCCKPCKKECCEPRCKYASVFGGWNMLDEYTGRRQLPPQELQGTFNDGWAIGAAKGRRINCALRGELEFAFRSNTADQWTVNGATTDWSGHLFTYSGMANLYHDFNNWELGGFSPYIGGGIGFAIFDGEFNTAATTFEIEDEAFAYQFIAGGSKRINCNVDLFAEYRFFGATEVELVDTGAVPDDRLGQLEPEFHNVFVGLRFYR